MSMTIYDIAKSCGVSIATVSRVINGSDKVSEKTRQKVLQAIEEQNYSPNPFARGLGLNSMKMIGILCTDIADAFYAKAVSLVEHDLRERGLDVILGCTGEELAGKKKYLELMLQKHVDAIILIGSPYREAGSNEHLANVAHEVPIITINSLIELPNIYCVLCDEAAGITQAVQELAASGCERLLYLFDRLSYSGQRKLQGYRNGLAAAGLSDDDKLVCQAARDMQAVRKTVEKLLAQNVKFDAIVAAEDVMAVGAQKALSAHELRLPVIGCNNSVLAECATPALTSIDNRLDILCPAAVDVLTKILEDGEHAAPSKTIYPAVIVHRESFPAPQAH